MPGFDEHSIFMHGILMDGLHCFYLQRRRLPPRVVVQLGQALRRVQASCARGYKICYFVQFGQPGDNGVGAGDGDWAGRDRWVVCITLDQALAFGACSKLESK